jgi:hypothetical protein
VGSGRSDHQGQRLLVILRRSTGSVVPWRRVQMILLSAQGMPVPPIAEVTFTSPDRVRDVIHNCNADGFDALYPRYWGGRPAAFSLAQRRQIKHLALSRPADHGLPFPPGIWPSWPTSWSLRGGRRSAATRASSSYRPSAGRRSR